MTIPEDSSALTEATLDRLSHLLQFDAKSDESGSSIVISTATLLEAHVDRLLELLIENSGVSGNRLGNAMLMQFGDSFSQSWTNRYRWLDDGFKIDTASFRRDAETLVDLRNALVHGKGGLTALQKRNLIKMIDMQKRFTQVLHVECSGGSIVLGEDTPTRALEVSKSFIVALDACFRTFGPSVRSVL